VPHSKGKSFKFYDAKGEVYPFYARTEANAVHIALVWSRRTGIKLYRRKK